MNNNNDNNKTYIVSCLTSGSVYNVGGTDIQLITKNENEAIEKTYSILEDNGFEKQFNSLEDFAEIIKNKENSNRCIFFKEDRVQIMTDDDLLIEIICHER